MNKIRNYWRNKKGITLVWGAFFLVVLLMFAGMAIDLSYMYYVKNQLQVAADAAALAGAATLDPLDTTTTQIVARQEAWKIACRNKAGNEDVNNPEARVYLVTNNPLSCDASLAGVDLNNSNASDGDIVVGNWNPTRASAPVDLRFLPIPGNPLPSGAIINAVKVAPRRTGETPGMPQVKVYLGQIFRLIGINWSFLSARASAIATKPPRASSFVSVGSTFCSNNCPGGSTYPDICSLSSPINLLASPTSAPDNLKFGWTSLLLRPGNSNEFSNLMCTTIPDQNICPPVPGIWGISGTSNSTLQDYESIMFDPNWDEANKEKDASGNVTGWWVMIPQTRISDPMFGPDPHEVIGYVLMRIIAVCAPGTSGCKGYQSPSGLCGPSGLYPNHAIVTDRISCIACGTEAIGRKPALVK